MCGIFGVIFGDTSLRSQKYGGGLIERLFILSESRGKEAAGLALAVDDGVTIYKTPITAEQMLKSRSYKKIVGNVFGSEAVVPATELAFLGHSRLVTDGARNINDNNQPVVVGGMVGVHNGIIVNHKSLWEQNPELESHTDLDSEVIFSLLRKHLSEGKSLGQATANVFSVLDGVASIAALFEDSNELLLATNNGSLYYRSSDEVFVFGSEAYILDTVGQEFPRLGSLRTIHLRPGTAMVVDTKELTSQGFSLTEAPGQQRSLRPQRRRIRDLSPVDSYRQSAAVRVHGTDPDTLLKKFPYTSMREHLRRCSRCVLPETMPYVDFDGGGVCSYCRNNPPVEVHPEEAINALVARYRKNDGSPDCIVGVSGGRDSMFGLHYVKCVLGLNPVAYTYDWGMVTNLARRNISRMCGKLGIEHILVSANIPQKREYIRKNVEAWLARPSLGTIPLFMAGDKAYFHHLNKARSRLGIDFSILCENPFERTDFKTGFAGVSPFHDTEHVYTLPIKGKLELIRYYGMEFLANPRYLNTSILDTVKAFAFYYLIDKDFHNLYRYVMWDEKVVEDTLLGEYDFERAEDTMSTWRIGDGTAAFYNYIYYALAGMTENDTFRSNQIRHGVLTREQALDHIDRDNRPRFQSIQWYLDAIGLDRSLEEVLTIINSTEKLYSQ